MTNLALFGPMVKDAITGGTKSENCVLTKAGDVEFIFLLKGKKNFQSQQSTLNFDKRWKHRGEPYTIPSLKNFFKRVSSSVTATTF